MNAGDDASGPLAGCAVVVTREQRGELGRRLDDLGATVRHVPLIRVVDAAPADVARLAAALDGEMDWLVVTSVAGADRVAAVASRPAVRLAAVGTATAKRLAELANRPVDLVPERQTAAALLDAFRAVTGTACRIVVAQADRAADTLVQGLTADGHDVEALVAYRTELRSPSVEEGEALATADAVAFASGSAVLAWADVFGEEAATSLPPIVAAIGPTTAGVAREAGLKVTHEATDHSLDGLIRALVEAWRSQRTC